MSEADLGTVLTLLRVIRGWNQEDLARASGVRNTSVSDYERGRKSPELRTLQRLVGAMGYSLSALDHARVFIVALRAQSGIGDGAEPSSAGAEQLLSDLQVGAERSLDPRAALQAELEQVSLDAGRVISRMVRVMAKLMGGASPARASDLGAEG